MKFYEPEPNHTTGYNSPVNCKNYLEKKCNIFANIKKHFIFVSLI